MDSSTNCPSPVRSFLRPRSDDGESGLDAGSGIADGRAGTHGRAIGSSGNRKSASRRLSHHVHALVAAVGAARAEALDARVDDVRLDGAHDVVVDVELLDDPGPVVLHEGVVVGQHRQQQVAALGDAEVDRDAALVAVPVDEINGVEFFAAWTPPAGIAGFRLFDFHHVGAKPRQDTACRRFPPPTASCREPEIHPKRP